MEQPISILREWVEMICKTMGLKIVEVRGLGGCAIRGEWRMAGEVSGQYTNCGNYNPESMEKPRSNTQSRRVLLWSVLSSAVINAFLFSAAAVGPHTLYRRIADMIAAPTGVVANRFFAPREHSASAFIVAALLSLAFSFVLYWIVSWIVMQGFLRLRSLRSHAG